MKLKEQFSVEKLKAREEKRNRSGRFNRMGAYVLDHLVMVFVENIALLAIWLVLLALGQVTAGGDINLNRLPEAFQIPTIIFIILLGIAYQVIVPRYFLNGQTFGKKLIGLKIVQANGEDATILHYLRRMLGIFLEGNPYVSFYGGVMYLLYFQYLGESTSELISNGMGYLFALSVLIGFFHKERRSLHDLIGGTKIVYVGTYDLADYNRPISKDIDLSNI